MTLLELFKLLRKHLYLVIILPVVMALGVAVVSWGFMSNQYTSTVSVYVLSSSDEEGGSIQNSDLNTSQLMANDIARLASSDTVASRTAAELGMQSLSGFKVSVESATTTRVIEISVTADRAEESALDQAQAPASPSGPPRTMYVAAAFLAGIFLAVAIVVVMDMVNTRVRTPEEAEELLGVPVIGRIPKIKG